MLRNTRLIGAIGLMVFGFLVRNVSAQVIYYKGEVNDAGPSAVENFGTDGFDLYATSLEGEPTEGGAGAFGPTRISNLPSYITSITSAGANSYFRSAYSPVINPLTNTLVHAGLTYNFSNSNQEKGLLKFRIGPGVPSVFFVGYLTDVTPSGAFDYPDGLRFRQTVGLGSGNSGLIPTAQDANGGIDLYLFRITGAHAGDEITISGFETIGGVNYYNLTAAGLTFSQNIPEPASLAFFALAASGWLNRRTSLVRLLRR